ncbi:MAG: GNAT family N-acetyltransferase [Anaerolineales bacterium]|nr:GNAT family N-acetyltransferase [Anaerolineales bacterium]
MEISVRPAEAADAEDLADLHHLVWPRDRVDPDRFQRLLAGDSHRAHIALDPLGVVGYADGFATESQQDRPRWELDLLAVHPRARRRGIGTELVVEQINTARRAGARSIRALVRLSNRGGHRTFARAGMTPDLTVYHLYTAPLGDDQSPKLPRASRLLEVETLTYDGLWLEGAITSEVIVSLLKHAAPDGDRLVGMLIDPHQIAGDDAEKMVAMTFVGAFQWYSLDFDSG